MAAEVDTSSIILGSRAGRGRRSDSPSFVDQHQSGDGVVRAEGRRLRASKRGGDRRSFEFRSGGSGSTGRSSRGENQKLKLMVKELTEDDQWLQSATRSELVAHILRSKEKPKEKHFKQLAKHAADMRKSPTQKTLLSFFQPRNPKDRTTKTATRPATGSSKSLKGSSVWTIRRRVKKLCETLSTICDGDLDEQVLVVDMMASQMFGREDMGRLSPEEHADNQKNSAIVAALVRSMNNLAWFSLELLHGCTFCSLNISFNRPCHCKHHSLTQPKKQKHCLDAQILGSNRSYVPDRSSSKVRWR